MNSVIETILKNIKNNKSNIFRLKENTEAKIKKELFDLLKWKKEGYVNNGGFFGQIRCEPDICLKFNNKNKLVIIEVKIVKQKRRDGFEWGYWIALSQGLIYSYQQQRAKRCKQNFLVLCIIFDWGRAAGRELGCYEKRFLDQVRKERVHFLRVNMSKKYIEHNMNTNWAIIKDDG